MNEPIWWLIGCLCAGWLVGMAWPRGPRPPALPVARVVALALLVGCGQTERQRTQQVQDHLGPGAFCHEAATNITDYRCIYQGRKHDCMRDPTTSVVHCALTSPVAPAELP
jgi:hypothetical protein